MTQTATGYRLTCTRKQCRRPAAAPSFPVPAITLVCACLVLSIASCASAPPRAPAPEAERLLPAKALAYARMDQATLALALAGLSAKDTRGARAIADRTERLTAAIVEADAAPGSAGGTMSDSAISSGSAVGTMSGSGIALLAVAEGRYPAGAASLKLATDPAWRRRGEIWEQKNGSLRLAFAKDGRALVGNAPLDGLLAALAAPNPDPIPARWSQAWDAPIALYMPDPMAFIRKRLPLGDSDIPVLAMMLSARPIATTGRRSLAGGTSQPGVAGTGEYLATLSFMFQSERAALIFAPLCRVFLYAAATALWPERSATVTDAAEWTRDGPVVTAGGIPLDAAALAAFMVLPGM